jgi:hypothetical protein
MRVVRIASPKLLLRIRAVGLSRGAIDGWRVVDDYDYRQAVGEPQAEGVMSTAASFSLS